MVVSFIRMSLRPLLVLSACLLGACERKDVAADSALPDSANTRSSLRENGGDRSGVTRRERGPKLDAVGEIDRVIRALAETTIDQVLDRWVEEEKINPYHPQEALSAIEAARPEEFDAIWEKVAGIKHKYCRLKLQAAAIYHLKAGKDLALACKMARELVPLTGEPPSEPLMGIPYVEDVGLRVLEQLWKIGEPSITESLALYRNVGSDEERSFMQTDFRWGGTNAESEADLHALSASGYRLSWVETEMILGYMSRARTLGGDEVLRGDQQNRARLHEIARSLEEKGVFARGAHELPLAEMGRYEPKVFFSMVPSEDRQDLLGKDHFDGVTKAIAQETPAYFFGSEGLANLPEGKISLALCAWCKNDPIAAEAWYAAHQSSVPEPQQELISEGFAKLAKDRQAFDEPQIFRLPDPEVRERK